MFYSDKPITLKEKDQLGRSNFAKMLAQALLELRNNDTFSIGLYGPWGSGKTSLVNMVVSEIEEQQKELLEKEKFIIIHFEPWNFSDTNQLLTQFFLQLSEKFCSKRDKQLSKIGDALIKYSDALDYAKAIPKVGGIVASVGKGSSKSIGERLQKKYGKKDIQSQREYVVELLKKQSQRILIIIDDIDRLNNDQIRQTFQLMTSVAGFPNTIYLAIFDKEIVVNALGKVQEGRGEDYLEKVIQMPIGIPSIQKHRIQKILLEKLGDFVDEHEDLYFQDEYWQLIFRTCVNPFVNSIRDINRLCNSVQFKLTVLAPEVNFADLIAISAIEIALPQIYEWIKNNKPVLTGEVDFLKVREERSQQEWHSIYSDEIQSCLQCQDDGRGSKYNSNSILEILSWLFPSFGRKIGETYEAFDMDDFRKNNQIAHPDRFDRYFDFDLDNIIFKRSEIQKAVYVLDIEKFKTWLLKCDEKNISYEFLEELKAMISEIPADRAKIIIEALLSISGKLGDVSTKQFLYISSSNYANYITIDLLEIIDKTERFGFFCDIIQNADLTTLQSAANIINMLELGYGRLSANGEARNYKKVIDLEDLVRLEREFTQRSKILLKNQNLFDVRNWEMVFYLLECFDCDYAQRYIQNALDDDKNVVRYLASTVKTWTGSGKLYEITDDYQKYITEDRILLSIETLKNSGELFSMDEKIQNKCGAFFLNRNGKETRYGRIMQSDVDELLSSWKK